MSFFVLPSSPPTEGVGTYLNEFSFLFCSSSGKESKFAAIIGKLGEGNCPLSESTSTGSEGRASEIKLPLWKSALVSGAFSSFLVLLAFGLCRFAFRHKKAPSKLRNPLRRFYEKLSRAPRSSRAFSEPNRMSVFRRDVCSTVSECQTSYTLDV